jgi:hypothetical protein
VIIAHDDTVIETGDHVILFLVDKKHIRDVEKLFHVGSELLLIRNFCSDCDGPHREQARSHICEYVHKEPCGSGLARDRRHHFPDKYLTLLKKGIHR